MTAIGAAAASNTKEPLGNEEPVRCGYNNPASTVERTLQNSIAKNKDPSEN